MNLLYVFEQGDPVLVATFSLLLLMSAASWYVMFWKGWKLRRERALLAMFRTQVMSAPNWAQQAASCSGKGSVGVLLAENVRLTPVLAQYDESSRKELLSMHLAQRLDEVRVWLDKGLSLLASIGSTAPFIGLFGTVWGIYGALTKIATAGNASLNVVAGPMGEALVATAAGLFAAIPAVLAYNAFVRSNRLLVQELRHIAEQLTLYTALPQKAKQRPANVAQLEVPARGHA